MWCIFILHVFLNEYYIGIYILRFVWIFVFIIVGGWLGSLLFKDWAKRIIPLGYFLLPPWEYLSLDIKVCTFSIDRYSFMISSIDFMVILCFGGIFFFYSDFIYWDWVGFSFDTGDYGHCVGWATVPVLNISFVIYWDVVSCGFILFLPSVRY